MKNLSLVILALVLLVFCSYGLNKSENVTSDAQNEDTPISKVASQRAKKSVWSYSEEIDEMSGAVIKLASVNSTNELELGFPYSGKSTFMLLLRKIGNDASEVILTIDNGSFVYSMDSESCRVKYDNRPVVNVIYNSSDVTLVNGDVIFFDSPASFIKNLKKSKKLLIEVPILTVGREIIRFDVENLKWGK